MKALKPAESLPHQLILTADKPTFDAITTQHWKDEGFDVTYIQSLPTRKDFEHQLHRIADGLDPGRKYAIIGLLLQRCY